MVTPYPALLYPIVEALPPRHAAVRRHPAPDPAVPFASLFGIGAIGSAGFAGRGREENGGGGGGRSGEQDSGQVGALCPCVRPPVQDVCVLIFNARRRRSFVTNTCHTSNPL